MHSSLHANPYARSLLSIILLLSFLFVPSLCRTAFTFQHSWLIKRGFCIRKFSILIQFSAQISLWEIIILDTSIFFLLLDISYKSCFLQVEFCFWQWKLQWKLQWWFLYRIKISHYNISHRIKISLYNISHDCLPYWKKFILIDAFTRRFLFLRSHGPEVE